MRQTKMKYTWDITTQKNFNEEELKTVNKIADMISSGFSVSELKMQMKKLNRKLNSSNVAMI